MDYTFAPIGRIHSCFPEKFGIPRQAGLVPDAEGLLEILPPFNQPDAFRGLEAFSHLWIVFVFHRCRRRPWKPTVRPPRLGGNRRVGVFASRSGFRPNPIGQSVVAFLGMERTNGTLFLRLGGVDVLDGTPVLDIKPYLPYADTLPHAIGGYAHEAPDHRLAVRFSKPAEDACRGLETDGYPHLQRLISDLLAHDPRPAYQGNQAPRSSGMRLWDLNIRFTADNGAVRVATIEKVAKKEV